MQKGVYICPVGKIKLFYLNSNFSVELISKRRIKFFEKTNLVTRLIKNWLGSRVLERFSNFSKTSRLHF